AAAAAASATLAANAVGAGGVLLPPEISLVLGLAGAAASLGALIPWAAGSLAGVALAATSGIALVGYSAVGWAGDQIWTAAAAFVLFASGVAAPFVWGFGSRIVR